MIGTRFRAPGRPLGATLLGASLVVGLAACGSDGGSTDNGGGLSTVKISSSADASGPTVSTQVPYQAGVKAFYDHYNANLEADQHPIEVQYLDDKYDVAAGLTAYRSAKSNGSVAIIGPNGSAQQPVLVEQGLDIPLLSGATSTILDNEYLWNTLPTFAPDQASIMVNYAKSQSDEPLRVAALILNVPSGVAFAEALEASTKDAGGTYLGAVSIEAADSGGDWRAQANKLAELKPNFIGVLSSSAHPQTFLPAIYNAGLTDVQVGGVTPLGPYKENWTSVPESIAEKFFVISSIMPAEIETDGSDLIKQAAQAAGEPDYANNIYFVQGWVVANMLADAINDAGANPAPADVNAAIARLNEWDSQGLNPLICFGPDDHYGTGAARPIYVDLATGKYAAAGEFSEYQQYVKTPNGTCG